ncbi:hypothetical protein NP493_115g11002 [Ridgeia piscesae]|uniref:SH3 domain-containing protein n=1 Tax=Ridgeia piscesae TaxID=27915 RepID=A0AAD9UH40_RIDPI|nr:hypothetical protein NP493_115g11002 [Ridgeia piscesae]
MVSASHTSSNNAPSSGGGGGGSTGVARVASGGSVPLYPPSAIADAVPNSTSNESPGRQAKVLYDYDAADMKELSLIADEVVTFYNIPGLPSDWVLAVRGTQKGNVPLSYLQPLD